MSSIKDLFPSRWLSKEDLPHPTVVTIQSVRQEPMMDNGRQTMKAVVTFVGNMKPMILNKGNGTVIASILGDDYTAWTGKQIELWVDPTIQMQGRVVGGVRVRPAPKQANGHAANPFAPAPLPAATGLWDIADGANKLLNQSADQVRDFLADCKVPLSKVWIKPSGTGNDQARTADQCAEQYGFLTRLPPAPAFEQIPF